MRRPAKTLPATPKVLPFRATAALLLLVAAAPVEDALAVPELEVEPVLEGVPAVVWVERVEVEVDDELSEPPVAAPVPVDEEVVVVLVELLLSELEAPPDLMISKVCDWARIPVFRGSSDRKLNLYAEPGVATKLVRVNLLSEVLTLSWMGMGTMLVWSTRTRLKVVGSVATEVH